MVAVPTDGAAGPAVAEKTHRRSSRAPLASLWASVDRVWSAVTLGEIPVSEGVGTLLVIVEEKLKVPCAFERTSDGALIVSSERARVAHAKSASRTSFEAFGGRARSVGRLTFHRVIEPEVGMRIARIAGRLVELAAVSSSSSHLRHDFDNALAALLSNVELVASIVDGADPGEALLPRTSTAERASCLHGIELSAEAARSLVKMFDALRVRIL